jgi:multicomponent Na+:H+ antiporter subunit C
MQVFPFLVVARIVAVGLYGIVTSHDLIHQIVCLIVVQSSTYVLLLGVGYVTGAVAPYFYDIPPHTRAVDPIVQALALTDVVVEAAVTARHGAPLRRRRGGGGRPVPGPARVHLRRADRRACRASGGRSRPPLPRT